MGRPRAESADGNEAGGKRRRGTQHGEQDSQSNPSIVPQDVESTVAQNRREIQIPIEGADLAALSVQQQPNITSTRSGSIETEAWPRPQDWQIHCPTMTPMQGDSTEPKTATAAVGSSSTIIPNIASPIGDSNIYDFMYENDLDMSFIFDGNENPEDRAGQQEHVLVPAPTPPVQILSSNPEPPATSTFRITGENSDYAGILEYISGSGGSSLGSGCEIESILAGANNPS